MKYFLSVIAMVLIIEGLPYFAFPEKMKEIFAMMQEIEAKKLRVFGVTLIGFGLVLLYFFK